MFNGDDNNNNNNDGNILQPGRLSYVILNYDKLGFEAADFRMNSRSGRCQVSHS